MTPSLGDRFRTAFRVMAGGYDAAADSRRRYHEAWNRSIPGTEDHIIGPRDREAVRLECRDLWRNNEIVRGAVNRFVQYGVWQGLWPQCQTSSKAWNQEAEQWWNEQYVPTADYRNMGASDLINLQRLCISHRILDGDLGFVLLENGQLQAIEGDRIKTPEKFNGDPTVVEGVVRKSGVVTGYFICDRNQDGGADTTKATFIRREDFVHCYQPQRIDQLRGIPDLAPAVNKLRDYDETDSAVLAKVKLDAYQAYKRWTKTGLPNERARGAYTKLDSSSKNPQRVEKAEGLQIHNLALDEDMEAFQSKSPNSEYVPYMKMELQAIACCLNISYEILLLIFTEGSFSSQRAALIHNRHTFLGWHNWLSTVMMDRIWNWRIAKAMKRGELPQAPVDSRGISEWYKKTWSLPYFDWVDPQKQAEADQTKYDMGLTSLKTLANSMGNERDDVLMEKSSDIEAAIMQADAINAKHPEAKITWRDIISSGKQPGQQGFQLKPKDQPE